MTFDAEFWVAICFFIFLWFAYKPVKKILFTSLDTRAESIKKELEEIDILRQEAAKTLEEYKKHQQRVEKEIKEIIANAEIEIHNMKQNAEKEVSDYLNKRSTQIMDRIASYETQVMQQLKSDAIQETVHVVETIIKENINEKISQDLLRNSINDISKKIH